MLIYRRTSMLESRAQTLVNTVNTVGVANRGLAHVFKKREPKMFDAYKRICAAKYLEPGKLWLWRGSRNWILNFPTKIHWRHPSKLEWIEAGLAKFALAYQMQGITEVSFPKLGCGIGNLEWNDVRPLMETYLADLPIKIYIHDYVKNIGLPGRLEAIAETARRNMVVETSFEAFWRLLCYVVQSDGDQMVELGSGAAFRASLANDDTIVIDAADGRREIRRDVICDVWLELESGLVSQKSAGTTQCDAGMQLLSLLSVLPGIRPVEIQLHGTSMPEFAVEREPVHRASGPVFPRPTQPAFARN